jgi:NAD-specific glutamate dehydrogenase
MSERVEEYLKDLIESEKSKAYKRYIESFKEVEDEILEDAVREGMNIVKKDGDEKKR